LLEANCEAEKLHWMMLIHYAKLAREKTASTQTSSNAETKKKILKERLFLVHDEYLILQS